MPITTDLVFYAFRYCLDRRTYAADDFISWARLNSNFIPSKDKSLMVKEIQSSTEFKDDLLSLQWNELAILFSHQLQEAEEERDLAV